MSKSKLLKSAKTSAYDVSKVRTVGTTSKGVKLSSQKQSSYIPSTNKGGYKR